MAKLPVAPSKVRTPRCRAAATSRTFSAVAYQVSVVTAIERWADWAETEARTWNDTVTPAETDLDTFRRILHDLTPLQQPAESPKANAT